MNRHVNRDVSHESFYNGSHKSFYNGNGNHKSSQEGFHEFSVSQLLVINEFHRF